MKLLELLANKLTLRPDRSPEAVLGPGDGACGFSQEAIEAAPSVDTEGD